MNAIMRWVGLALYLGLALFLLWFGFVYATVEKMLWFHAAAVPEAAREAVGPLYFGLMRLVGTFSIGLSLATLLITLGPIRSGSRIASFGLAIVLAIPFLGAAIVAERLAAQTGSPTSWHIMGILMLVDALALGACVIGHRRTAMSAPSGG